MDHEKKKLQEIEKSIQNWEIFNQQLKVIAENAPPGGYFRAIKKRFFRPKTNWTMLSTLIGFATLLATVFIYFASIR